MDFTGSGSEDDPIQFPEPKRIKLTIDDSEVTIDDSEPTIDDSEPTIDDTETIEYRTLPIYDYGEIPTGADQEPHIVRTTKTSAVTDFDELHNKCFAKITNSWHTGNKPMLGCQGIYSIGPVAYYSLCKQLRITAGFYNRAWKRSGTRCIWWSPDKVSVPMDPSGFTKLNAEHIPKRRVLLVAPPFTGSGYVHIPAYHEDPAFHPAHGICGDVDYTKLDNPGYIESLDQRDKHTWHFEHGGVLKISLLWNSLQSCGGLYIDKVDFDHFHAQCQRFKGKRNDPKLKIPRAWTAKCTSVLPDWEVVALYMLHGLGHAHVFYGKVVADFGLAGNGGLSNRGKLCSVTTKDGRQITSTADYRLERKTSNIADPEPDFLIQGSFTHHPDEIVQAMSQEQRELFKDGLLPALYKVHERGAEAYLDCNSGSLKY